MDETIFNILKEYNDQPLSEIIWSPFQYKLPDGSVNFINIDR